MKKKQEFRLYTGMWAIATLFLLFFLWKNMGDARVINYSGLVRGATQKLVKEELAGEPNDDLILYLDQIIYSLQTGKGEFGLIRNSDDEFQERLSGLKLVWEDMKTEISAVRENPAVSDRLYALSQQHFALANEMVSRAEQVADRKLALSISIYCVCLLLSIAYFAVAHRRNQRKIENSLSVDRLTGLLSRSGFEVEAEKILHGQQNRRYLIVEFDVANFKRINRSYGYAQGDLLLRSMAEAVKSWIGTHALCARINADDFILLAEDREELLPELEDRLKRAEQKQHITVTFGDIRFKFGAYRIMNNSEQIRTVMDKANTAHKAAKRAEQKSCIWYDEKLIEKLELENWYKERLDHALRAGEFQLYLQPKIALSTMEIIGAEALVRWEIPDHGLIFPDSFIPLFEKDGSIAALDYYMLEKACEYLQAQFEQGKPACPISVNFSRVTLYREEFFDAVLEIVDRYGVPYRYIEVEVTESAFNEVTDAVLQTIQRLQEAGFLISMDDFGAGYSNLNLLGRLPIQIIKLDREFMRTSGENKNVKGIVACMVDIAHAMGIKVVCEGVEEEGHVEFLRNISCDYAQGYYFSKPIPSKDFGQVYQ